MAHGWKSEIQNKTLNFTFTHMPPTPSQTRQNRQYHKLHIVTAQITDADLNRIHTNQLIGTQSIMLSYFNIILINQTTASITVYSQYITK